jgi:hypothetical protein
MSMKGNWMLMFHRNAFAVDTAVELADYSHPAFATAYIELLLDRDLLVLS